MNLYKVIVLRVNEHGHYGETTEYVAADYFKLENAALIFRNEGRAGRYPEGVQVYQGGRWLEVTKLDPMQTVGIPPNSIKGTPLTSSFTGTAFHQPTTGTGDPALTVG